VPLAGLALIWAPSIAHAAVQLAVPKGCIYASSSSTSQTIPFNVSGMAAGAHYVVALDGTVVTSGTANATGDASGTFASPSVHHAERQAVVSVSDGTATASKTIDLTDFDAGVTPAGGSTRRAVHVSLWGWVGKTVFLHYLAPRSKKAARTVRIARTTGTCGHAQARIPHLFPAGTKKGNWKLVFDSKRRLGKPTDPLRIDYTIAVR
jgi:hypothetical protein